MRPQTLQEVARLTAAGDSFDRCLANFLDEFYAAPSAAAVLDAYLAATAEELARRFAFPLPAWTVGEHRQLHRPWFATPLAAVRAVLLLESPPGFRARNLFVSENALSRA